MQEFYAETTSKKLLDYFLTLIKNPHVPIANIIFYGICAFILARYCRVANLCSQKKCMRVPVIANTYYF